jgi:drug/metabolite transporter (DMT)-like permease
MRTLLLTCLAMFAFAANSLLCRVALRTTSIDPATFTAVRLVAGALMLGLIGFGRSGAAPVRGNWGSALALFAYAAGFSYAYRNLTAATGALLLFGAVQATMIGVGALRGERLGGRSLLGLLIAVAGLVALLAPGLSAPPPAAAALMLGAGAAWGIYTRRGRGAGDATQVTAGNFLRAAPMALALAAVELARLRPDPEGMGYGLASGALASGVGYAVWYRVVPALAPVSASVVQLSVPVIASLGGYLLLGEPITLRLVLASVTILGGIGLVIGTRAR